MKNFILVGNPNTGKTTIFNYLTMSDEHVGNWHGVTVEEKEKIIIFDNKKLSFVDLPGCYSLTPLSFEEEVATTNIINSQDKTIINICDINNLQRNLYLTMELIESGKPTILLVNEIGKKQKKHVDYQKLQNLLGIKVLPFSLNKSKKNEILLNLQGQITQGKVSYIKEINAITKIENIIKQKAKQAKQNSNFCAVKLFEKDEYANKILCLSRDEQEEIDKLIPENSLEILAQKRYEYIDAICKLCVKDKVESAYGESKLDRIILNKYLALPIFLGIMVAIFYITFFSLGAHLSNLLRYFIDNVIGENLVSWLNAITTTSWFVDMIKVAVVSGVGSLICFLPQICLLFLFLCLLEDSGYLARIAFLFEDMFQKVGLSGKSVYTLLMGFGCSTTASLTARNMEDKNAKIKTVMLAPYMSCSAKLPIYSIIGGAFFGAGNVFIVFGLYLLGVVIALLLSLFWEKKYLKSIKQTFILEFPPYRLPSLKRVVKTIFSNVWLFVKRVGSVIISMNVIVWILESFSFTFAYTKIQGGTSMLEHIGKIISPIFVPLGFGDWSSSSALLVGFVAKELVVSSLTMFNGPSFALCFSPASALSFMVFCLLYSPCLATVLVLSKEIGKKWTFISMAVQLVVAYICSFIVFNLFKIIFNIGFLNTLFWMLGIFVILFSIIFIFKKIRKKSFCENCKIKCNLINKY